MDLEQRHKELLAEKEKQEAIRNTAHKKILELNGQLRKLHAFTRKAEEMFKEKQDAN